jgi:hypothetical protein
MACSDENKCKISAHPLRKNNRANMYLGTPKMKNIDNIKENENRERTSD